MKLTRWAGQHRPTGWRLPVSTFVVFTAIGLLAIPYPQLLGNGKGPAQLAFAGTLPWSTLVALLILKPVVTAACLRSGATGGRLTPAVATGALLGAVTGKAWLLLWPGSRAEDFAIVAAAGFLAVTISAPRYFDRVAPGVHRHRGRAADPDGARGRPEHHHRPSGAKKLSARNIRTPVRI